MLSDKFTGHADAINNQTKQLSIIQKTQQKDNKKLLELISIYSELATAGLTASGMERFKYRRPLVYVTFDNIVST